MNKLLMKKMMASDSKPYKVLVGLACALNYAIYPALIALFAGVWKNNTSVTNKIALGFTIVTGKELFSFLVFVVIAGPKNFATDIKGHLFSKNGVIVAIAGMFGGPIGYSMVTIGALFVGGALAATLTSTTIIFTALLEWKFLKRKFHSIKIIGVVIAGISIILLSVMAADQWNWSSKSIIGIIFSLMGALSWSIENILMDYGMSRKKPMPSSSALKIKLLTSSLLMLLIFMPISTLATGHSVESYKYFTLFFSNMKMFWGIAAVGLFIALARFFFLKSIKLQGATIGVMWYSLANLLTPMIILIFIFFGVSSLQPDIATLKTWWFWVFGLCLFVGVIMGNLEPRKKSNITTENPKENN